MEILYGKQKRHSHRLVRLNDGKLMIQKREMDQWLNCTNARVDNVAHGIRGVKFWSGQK